MCEHRCCQIIYVYALNCLSIVTTMHCFPANVFSFIVDTLNLIPLKLICNCYFPTFPVVPSEMVERGYTVWCGWNTGSKSVNCNASGIEVCRLCQDTGKILLNKQYLADNGWRFHIPGSSHVVSESG